MNIYPTDERRIREVERSRSCQAVVPLPPGGALAAGDVLLFALARSSAGQEPDYLMGGDSVRVLLTGVTDLDEADPVTGLALVQLSWEPLGLDGPPASIAPKAYHTQISRPSSRLLCPVCHEALYSRATIHPQCASHQYLYGSPQQEIQPPLPPDDAQEGGGPFPGVPVLPLIA
jgi:hypothetical protein